MQSTENRIDFDLTDTPAPPKFNFQNGGRFWFFGGSNNKLANFIEKTNIVELKNIDGKPTLSTITDAFIEKKLDFQQIYDFINQLAGNEFEIDDYMVTNKYGMNILHIISIMLNPYTLEVIFNNDSKIIKFLKENPEILNSVDNFGNNIGLYIIGKTYGYLGTIEQKKILNLLESIGLKRIINNEIERINKNLEYYEKIRRFKVLNESFSMECDELTPTLKVRREIIKAKRKKEIEEMYDV